MKRVLLAAALALSATFAHAERIAIVGATVIHPELGLPRAVARDSTVIIDGNRIARVGPVKSTPVPKDAQVIDGKGRWVVPGLIDAHVHFFQSGNLYTRPDGADFNAVVTYAKETERNKARLPATFKVWLASGVTSVVDIGGPFWNFDMRDASLKTDAAPRVAVAGPLISMVDRVKLDIGDPPIIKISSPDEARALVRLAVHATELLVAKASLRAGADYLVHSVEDAPVDDEFLALAQKNHAIYCPTLFVVMGYRYALSNTWQPTEAEQRLADPQILAMMRDLDKIPADKRPERVAKAMANPPQVKPSATALANLNKVWDAGILVAMGTDAGNIGTLHGPSVFREMALMAQAGLTNLEVLRSATTNGAKVMGRDVGALAPGKLADVLILDADPLADLQNLSRIHRVIKDGKVYSPEELMRSIKE